jgi:hypothetical protein
MMTIRHDNEHCVTVTGVELSFGQMVTLLVNLALAGIPAAIIVTITVAFFGTLFLGFLGAIFGIAGN